MQDALAEAPLEHLAALASRAGVDQIAHEARSLEARVAEGRFYLACVGQFKRGKSTLLDALLEDPLLPVGILPVTALPTVVRYGPERSARVLLRGAAWEEIDVAALSSYVSEEENPENEKDVAAVEVFLRAELLATGMCLVDTPGIGSVFEANSAATYSFIPHIDAALVVLGADPPITSEELTLAMKISQRVENVLFVLNKADRVSRDEVAAAKQFACSVLGRRLGRPIEIYEVSAKEQLEGKLNSREWAAFAAALAHLVSVSGRRLVWLAQQRGAARLSAWLSAVIAEERKALVEPLEQSEARLHKLNDFIEHSEQAIRDLGLLLLGEQQGLSNRLEQRRQEFVASILPSAKARLSASAASAPSPGPAMRRFAMQAALSIAREGVLPWLKVEEEIVDEEYTHITERFTTLANSLLRDLADAGGSQITHVGDSIEGCGQLAAHSQFQFHQLMHIAQPASPFRHAADFTIAAIGISAPIWRDAERFLEHVIETNSSRIQGDLERRLALARKELELAIRGTLLDAKNVAAAILARARETRAAGEAAVHQQLTDLAKFDREIAGIAQAISRASDAGAP
jgi:hypothetical protein